MVVACSPWLPSSFCIPSLQPLHIGLTCPNLHPDALDTVPCKQGVHLEEKSFKALTFYLQLLPHSPAPFLPRLCRAQVCGSTWWGQGTADPTAPGPSAGHIPAAPHTPQAQGKEYWVPVRGLPFPHLIPALTRPTHTRSLAHATAPMQTHALTFTHTHS